MAAEILTGMIGNCQKGDTCQMSSCCGSICAAAMGSSRAAAVAVEFGGGDDDMADGTSTSSVRGRKKLTVQEKNDL